MSRESSKLSGGGAYFLDGFDERLCGKRLGQVGDATRLGCGCAVRVDIVERVGDDNARLQVFSPVGMYLPRPVKLTIDQGEPHNVPYTWCLTNACIAGAVATPKMVEEMASGQTLRLEFVDSNLLTLATSLPLGQFAAVHKAAPAQVFEQDIDE